MNTSTTSPPTPPDAMWLALDDAQADGLACVVCGRDYLARVVGRPVTARPVGRSRTGSQVMACAGECREIATVLVERAAASSTGTDPSASVRVTSGGRSEAGT